MTPSSREEEIRKDFELYWGFAPEGTPKHKAREKALEFFLPILEAYISHERKELREAITKLKRDCCGDDCGAFCHCSCHPRNEMIRDVLVLLDQPNTK